MDRLRVTAGLMAGLAHDLVNHLGVIETSAHLARTSPEKHLARVEEHARFAQALLRAVMAVARGEPPTLVPTPAADLVARAIAASGARAGVAPSPEGATLVCQPTLVAQALVNLLKNAAEAAGAGGAVTVGWEADALVVTDDGPGFPEDFDVDGVLHTTKEGGTGLGLAVARAVAELHGGALHVVRDGGITHVILRVGARAP